jgi:hypothetical protein
MLRGRTPAMVPCWFTRGEGLPRMPTGLAGGLCRFSR